MLQEKNMSDKIKILVVDDSKIYRNFITQALKNENDLEIIGYAENGLEAIEMIQSGIIPDIVSLDIEMPVMNGIETLKEIIAFNNSREDLDDIGVLMVSSLTRSGADVTIESLELGAFDFVYKPDSMDSNENIENLRYQIVTKMHTYMSRKDRKVIIDDSKKIKIRAKEFQGKIKAIFIATSTGGPRALAQLLPELSKKTDLPIFLVLQMPPVYILSLASNLNSKCEHEVVEASDGVEVLPKHIYIAPGNRHLLLKKEKEGAVKTSINDAPPENGKKPSVDILLRSAAMVYGGDAITIILTGMGSDGTAGLRPFKRKGGLVIAQDEETSTVWGMPGNVVNANLADYVLPITEIDKKVEEILKTGVEK
jgi:two-component system chemotaxis response regulator CheB